MTAKTPATTTDETHDPARRSWVLSANSGDTDFPIQNLPLGIFSLADGEPRFGVAIGDAILDIGAALRAGLLSGTAADVVEAGRSGQLNAVFAMGAASLKAFRKQIGLLLDAQTAEGREAQAVPGLLHDQAACAMHLPVQVKNYTDFYAGIHHARAAGALLMPENPLPPNYKFVPIAYHGRASSVRVSGGDIKRPLGQRPGAPGQTPTFGPCEKLDLELEMGFYVGQSNALGEPIPMAEASSHIAGLCLLNDWSARDIQRWEMVPLGPFLGKNFSTTVSPWVITLDALQPFRTTAFPRPEGDPAPLDYLTDEQDTQTGGFDIELAVLIRTERMRQEGQAPVTLITSNARHLYWTLAQMIAHHSSGGCNLQSGDLIGTGTISGPTRQELSSLLELTMGGLEPATLPNGEQRGYLNDGDEIFLTAKCHRDGFTSIGFGSASGRIVA